MTPSVARDLVGLVVDDDPHIRHLHVRVLMHAGIHALQAPSAEAALALAHSCAPSVVVTDIDMPGLDGVSLCRELRRDRRFKDTLIIVVSGNAGSQGDAAKAAGCDAVLVKPCSPSLLLATIESLLVKPS